MQKNRNVLSQFFIKQEKLHFGPKISTQNRIFALCYCNFMKKVTKTFQLGMIHIWRPWKLPNFQDHPPPLSIYVQISSNPLTLDVQFQTNLPSPNDKQSWSPIYMLSNPSFRSAFVFSINSLILPGFSLTSFNCAEASLSAFSWLYTLVCVVVKKFRKCLLFIITLFFIRTKALILVKISGTS